MNIALAKGYNESNEREKRDSHALYAIYLLYDCILIISFH